MLTVVFWQHIPGVTAPETDEERAKREAIDTIPEEEEQDLAAEEADQPAAGCAPPAGVC